MPNTFSDTTASDSFVGDTTTSTVDYSGAERGVVANLSAGSAYKVLHILPLGDSITYGVNGYYNTESGGYRAVMAEALAARGVQIDFVGSLNSGPAEYDMDHEGRRGWSIDELDAEAGNIVAATDPDAVLLMAGTNDTATDTATQMIADLRALILSLSTGASDARIFVGSIPPINGETQGQDRADRADAFNDALPGLVEELVALGHDVVLVDMRSLTLDDITAPPDDSGLHPTAEGYGKIADLWLAALEEHLGLDDTGIGAERDQFTNIANLVGSAHADDLTGDAASNALTGGGGGDVLDGQGGNDLLAGGAGNDEMTGGAGQDVFAYAAGDGADVITDLAAGSNGDRIDISGYQSYTALEQVGADTRITLSSTDSILLSNVSASELTAETLVFLDDGQPPDPLAGAITAYLVDADTDQIIGELTAGAEFDGDALEGRNLTVYATANVGDAVGGQIESIRLDLDGSLTRVESMDPYALFGDKGGTDFLGGTTLAAGDHTMQFELFSEEKASGSPLGTVSMNFTVTEPTGDPEPVPPPPPSETPALTAYLVDADTDQIIGELTADAVFAADDLQGRSLTIYAVENGPSELASQIESVRLDLDETLTRVESMAPYALFGDKGGTDFLGGTTLAAGEHTLSLELFSSDGAGGENLGTMQISFSVEASDGSSDPDPYASAIVGSTGPDTLNGTSANDTIYGFEGNDTIDGGGGADTMIGGAGDDVYFVDNAGDVTEEEADAGLDATHARIDWTLADNVETLFLRTGAHIDGSGNALANTMYGNSGSNVLDGAGGADWIEGRGGDDTIAGGLGDDTLTGNEGDDTFVFRAGDGADLITDFAAGSSEDQLEIIGYGSYAALEQEGANTRVVLSQDDSILLLDVSKDQLDSSDFVFHETFV